uniref:Vitellogenin domain-containing protein n=1 Tax=Astyanax mexicanus TaxID=7994 RepID=A0A8B9K7F3_ASTMX
MRAVVLALTVALVVPEFAAGKTYVYKYEGLLLGGLPQEGLGKAGVKVSSKVLIRAEASTTFLLKVKLFLTVSNVSTFFLCKTHMVTLNCCSTTKLI